MSPTESILISQDMKSLMIIAYIIMSVSLWKIFEKAGIEGWKALVPFYNMWILAEIATKPGWLGLTMALCPMLGAIGLLAALVIQIVIYSDLAKVFSKSLAFTIGLIVLPVVFFPILAFGKSEVSYQSR